MLQRKLMVGKFGEELESWCSWKGRKGHEVGLWMPISKFWETSIAKTRSEGHNGRRFFSFFIHFCYC